MMGGMATIWKPHNLAKPHRDQLSLRNNDRVVAIAPGGAMRTIVEGLDTQAEVVEVAALAPRRGAAGPAERAVDGHQIDQRTSGAQLHEADLVLPAPGILVGKRGQPRLLDDVSKCP